MGCSISKLDDEEVIQLCKDRRRFIKQAVEHRIRFAAGHIEYIQSLRRVSLALHNYVEGDEHREFFSDSYSTPPFTPIKKTGPEIFSIPLKSLPNKPIQSETKSCHVMNYLRSGGNTSVSIEERPQSPENVRIESYSPMHHFGIDGFFTMQSSPMTSSSFFSSPYNRPSFPPLSPQTSQWDFFWNPFTSLDTYGYPTHNSLDDEMARLRQVREEEGIPDLEEEEEEEDFKEVETREERAKVDLNCASEAVDSDNHAETDMENDDIEHEVKGYQSQSTEKVEVMKAQNEGLSNEEEVAVSEREAADEMPDFTVYVNRRPTSMAEVIKDLETQFTIVCDSANKVSIMLEASRAQYSSSNTNELTAIKMLNPVALFRSVSSRSSSSRFFHTSSGSRDDGYDSSSDLSEESCMFSGSHQSTLDRLYAWEKKLYEEVKSGERIRIAYEKKCMQLRNQDAKGEESSSVDKTRVAIRDLHTRIKVCIHSVESISKRIETLRDEELQPQLMELLQGLARMWRVMAECHISQKRTIDAAKILLAGAPPKLAQTPSLIESHRLARSAASLESELRNWRFCFDSWIVSQRSYARALSSWFLRCSRSDTDTDTVTDKLPFSSPIFGICIQWSKFLDTVREVPVIEGLEFFAAGLGSLYSREEEERKSKRFGVGFSPGSGGNMEMVEVVTEEKTAEIAVKVLCAGMSVALNSLTEFAVRSAEGYEELVGQCQKATVEYEAGRGDV